MNHEMILHCGSSYTNIKQNEGFIILSIWIVMDLEFNGKESECLMDILYIQNTLNKIIKTHVVRIAC